ncbi:hypothetical protein Cantr_03343 [Candida viswanathii]|uniref:LicD/FKTN/FKRP nucleotidyltransferase domain-containing protein n=1 Tax=Candida viswanathii TaxID=5486 RepID=A0A367YNW4_9ASCO|nr:hypothetical protein Cantr_03343 [Candida viswanathii]
MALVRRSRGVVFVTAFLAINLIIVSLFHIKTINRVIITSPSFDYIKKLIFDNPPKFNLQETDELYKKVLEVTVAKLPIDSEQYKAVNHPELPHGEALDVFQIPADIPKSYQRFDPRFTFGLLLQYINAQENVHGLEIPSFHWSDYVDMTSLEMSLFAREKRKCLTFDVTRKNPRTNLRDDLVYHNLYCIDDLQIDEILNDEKEVAKHDAVFIERLRDISKYPISTGFHVFAWSGRNSKNNRPLLGKSYVMDFMPPPSTLVFLLPDSKRVQFNINQNNRKKLTYTPEIFKQDVVVDLNQEVRQLLEKLPAEDHLPYEKHLKHKAFVDNSQEMLDSLRQQESSLNQTDRHYMMSLENSLAISNPPKYFYEGKLLMKEANFAAGGHYDWRFMDQLVNNTPKLAISIHQLIKTWLRLTNQYGLSTWIAHGSLLSWYWNGLQFPWDSDIDVQMPIQDLHKLSRHFNQSMIVDFGNDESNLKYGRFFLDVSNIISHRTRGNGNNNIDARFVDVETGLYIDITGLALSETKAPVRYNSLLHGSGLERSSMDATITQQLRNNYLQAYNCRNNHFSRLSELSPLRLSLAEGEFAYVPSEFETMLKIEYGEKSMANVDFRGYVYLPKLRLWVPKKPIVDYALKDLPASEKSTIRKSPKPLAIDLNDDQYLEFLNLNLESLLNYLVTNNVTMIHENEIIDFLDGRSTKSIFFNSDGLPKFELLADLRQDLFKFKMSTSNYDYAAQTQQIRTALNDVTANDENPQSESDPLENADIANELPQVRRGRVIPGESIG